MRHAAIRKDDLVPGQCVSVDQWVSTKTPGRLTHTFGKERVPNQYHGGTIFYDHASAFIYINPQVNLRIGTTVQAKHAFEHFAHGYGVKVKSYRADNKPFRDKLWADDMTCLVKIMGKVIIMG